MNNKKWLKGIITILIIWFAISAYFYMQHYITIRQHVIGKQVILRDITINIEKINIENFTAKLPGFGDDKLRYKIAEYLPEPLVMPFLKTCYFYSKPYEFNNKLQTVKLKGKLVSGSFIGEGTDGCKDIKIDVVDEVVGVHYSSEHSLKYKSNSNVILFEVRRSNFPIEKASTITKILITDKKNNVTKEIEIKPKFIKKSYDFFDKKPKPLY